MSQCRGLPPDNSAGFVSAAYHCGQSVHGVGLEVYDLELGGIPTQIPFLEFGGTQEQTRYCPPNAALSAVFVADSIPEIAGATICTVNDLSYADGVDSPGEHTYRFTVEDCGGALPAPGQIGVFRYWMLATADRGPRDPCDGVTCDGPMECNLRLGFCEPATRDSCDVQVAGWSVIDPSDGGGAGFRWWGSTCSPGVQVEVMFLDVSTD